MESKGLRAVFTVWAILPVGLAACADLGDDATETPNADTAIEPIQAPFAMPELERPSFARRRFDIRSFGAVGDGTTNNTAAFARAVAAAKAARGGQIIVPAGRWLTGPIQITNDDRSCDGIDLHVE